MPLSLHGVISGALFACLAWFHEPVVSLFPSGVRTQTPPVCIWNSPPSEMEPAIAAVGTFLIGITALILLLDTAIRRRAMGRRQ